MKYENPEMEYVLLTDLVTVSGSCGAADEGEADALGMCG